MLETSSLKLYTVASLYLFVNSVDKTKLSFQENWKSFVLFALAPTKTNRGPFHKSNAPFLQICWLIKIFMALSNIAIFSSKLSARFNFFWSQSISAQFTNVMFEALFCAGFLAFGKDDRYSMCFRGIKCDPLLAIPSNSYIVLRRNINLHLNRLLLKTL